MKRQNYLIVSLFILASILFSNQTLVGCAPKTKSIGIQLYSVRDAMNEKPTETLAQLGEIGFRHVEAAGYADGMFYGMEPEAFRDLVQKNGMEFLASHTGRDIPDSIQWDETMAWWDACIDAHKRAGVQFIVQPWMGQVGYQSLDGLKRACDYFNQVGAKCHAQGIRFGYHNHDKEFGLTADSAVVIYDFMLANTQPENVFFQMDVYWAVVGGKNPVDYFNAYPGRFELLHIKDKEELGASGMMDFEPIFKQLEKAGTKYIIVEVERYNFDPIESVRKSFEFLNEADYVQ